MHSGILKTSATKSYHPYLSNDRKHDHIFVHLATGEMLKESEINPDMHMIIKVMTVLNGTSQCHIFTTYRS